MSENRDHDLELTRLEGRNPVAEALAAGRSLNSVYVLENARGDLAALAARCRQQAARVDFVSRAVLDSMALTRAHQGIIAEAAPYAYSDLNGILQTCKEEAGIPFFFCSTTFRTPTTSAPSCVWRMGQASMQLSSPGTGLRR